jgi:outer membrane autotransporter protein
MPHTALADCTIGNTSATCDNSHPNPYNKGIGDGSQNNYAVTLNGSTSTSNAVEVSPQNKEAIAINNGGTINIGNYASVLNSSNSGGGPSGTGNNTIDFNSNTSLTIGVGATVASNGSSPTAEAIHPRGTGNTITNNGLIFAAPSYAMFFGSTASSNTVINNASGVIRSTHGAMGSSTGANVTFVNYGLVDGDLVFQGSNDQLTLYTGSQITGSLQGGGGSDNITLAGTGTQSLPGAIKGFATLKKIDSGTWTLNGTITGNMSVDVSQGTLVVTGDNTGFTGAMVVDTAGSLTGLAGSLPPAVTDNGQVQFAQTADGTYAGTISGTGGVSKSGGGILKLTSNQSYAGGTLITAGELQLGDGGNSGSVVGNITDNGNLSFNRSDTTTFPGQISGSGNVRQIGSGTTILTASNTYAGGTSVDIGSFQLGNNGTTGSIAGTVAVNGNGTLTFDRSDVVTFPGVISGSGHVAQIGSGTTILSGDETYTGATTISSGTLQVGAGGTSGTLDGDITDNGSLVFNRSDSLSYDDIISGVGTLTQAGTGTLILTQDHTFTGPTTIAAGTLQLGNGSGAAGTVAGNIVDHSALVFDHADSYAFAGVISGSGTVTHASTNVLTLSGANTYTGQTTVAAGRLNVDGAIAGNVQVDNNAMLGGIGSIAGAVNIANGGHLSPGDSPGTLHVGSLVLNSGSQLDYEFGLPNIVGGTTNDLTEVAGNLTLAGTLNITDLGGFSEGVYRVFDYGGTLTDNGLAFGTLPAGFTTSDLQIQTSLANQVNLIVVAGGTPVQYWNGAQTPSGKFNGGTGPWNTSTVNWTTASGSASAPWNDGFAVFQGAAGTVTLTENVEISGMQFLTTGYLIEGNGYTLEADPSTDIRVDPGLIATIHAPIIDGPGGPATLIKRDDGTLVLSGANTYSGGTAIDGGALQVGSDGNLGAASGGLSLDTGTLETTASFGTGRHVTLNAGGGTFAPVAGTTLALSGVVDGVGTLTKADAGTLVLSGNNSYGGGTVLRGGILGVSSDASLGATSGLLDFSGGTLQFESSFNPSPTRAVTLDSSGGTIDTNGQAAVFAQIINGSGSLTKLGSGTLVLAADELYDGTTTISAGTLQLGNGGTVGSTRTNITDNATLAFKRADTLVVPTVISGSGGVMQLGSGTTELAGTNTYTGGTTISAGTLQIGDDGTLGSITGDVVNNAALVFYHSDDITFGGKVTGSGTLAQNGDGTLFITGSVTEASPITINAGTLSIGNGTLDGNVATDIVDNSALVFHRSSTTYGNLISGPGTVQQLGPGTLTLTGNNTYSGITTITAGAIQIGNGATTGSLGSGDVVNNALLAFNRSDTMTVANAISGSGAVAQIGAGTTLLTGASSYTGPTLVQVGRLAAGATNVFSPNSAYTVTQGATLDLQSFDQTVASVTNAGMVHIARDPGAVLTTSSYVGQGGTLAINTYLDGDTSPSDNLVITGGTATGTTTLRVTNVGGPGGQTTANGIPVVQTANGGTTQPGAFVQAPGELRAGAFDYRLFRGGIGGDYPDDWFLRSDFIAGETPSVPPADPAPPIESLPIAPPPAVLPPGEYPIIGPELSTYGLAQPMARLQGLTTLGTLHERIGDTGAPGRTPTDAEGWVTSGWARVFGQQIDHRYESYPDSTAQGSLLGLQTGVDLWRGNLWPDHVDAAGLYFAYGHSDVDAHGLVTNQGATAYVMTQTGTVRLNAYAGGAYWTHYGPGGWYVDAVLQGTHYDGTARTSFASLSLSGWGAVASLEAGYPIAVPLGAAAVVEPQAQVVWQRTGLDTANDGTSEVTLGTTSGVSGRLGVRLQWTVASNNGLVWQPYLRVNLWRDAGGRASTVFDHTEVVPLAEQATRLDAAAGVTAYVTPSVSFYGQFGYAHSIAASTDGNRKGVWGNAGLRFNW